LLITHDLEFRNDLPILFNILRHIEGLNALRPEIHHLFKETKPKLQELYILPLFLHWHQVVGICTIICKVFSVQLTQNVLGVLLADEVGLGKTFHISTVIVFLMELVQHQQKKLPLPLIICMHCIVFLCILSLLILFQPFLEKAWFYQTILILLLCLKLFLANGSLSSEFC